MALTHDGLQEPLPPSRLWQLVGLGVTLGGVGMVASAWYCTGLSVLVLPTVWKTRIGSSTTRLPGQVGVIQRGSGIPGSPSCTN